MTRTPSRLLASTMTVQYTRRSYRTRHAPAEMPSHELKSSVSAMARSAASASASKAVSYGVALIASVLPRNKGWKDQNASRTSRGELGCGLSFAPDGRCCSQYQRHTSDSSIVSLHPVVGASDGKGRPAAPQAQIAPGRSGGVLHAPAATGIACEPSSPRASSSLRAGWGWLIRAARRLDDHWIGDLIGAVCLFGMLWIGLVAAMVFE